MNHVFEKGLTAVVVIVGVAVIAVLGVGVYIYQRSSTPEATTLISSTPTQTPVRTQQNQPPATAAQSRVQFTGEVLAGSKAVLLDFNQADYEAARASGKLIVLYYYANWCPICRAEFPKAEAAFTQLQTDQVVGFRVNFNDDQTDNVEEGLAREHGVAYQHTKVFVKNGQRILKSPETWETDRYVSEIMAALR